jgi:PIH1 N-terminal domain
MDAYLSQLEANGQVESMYGKGVTVISPEPWFVIKTRHVGGATRVYINVCTSAKVSDPKSPMKSSFSPCPIQSLSLGSACSCQAAYKRSALGSCLAPCMQSCKCHQLID